MNPEIPASDLIVPVIILVVTGLISVVLISLAVAQWIKVAAARRWPVAQGTVLESQVVNSRDSHGAWSCRPIISYKYEVSGQIYTNNQLAFGERSLSRGGAAAEKKAQDTVARYPLGGQVEVHYQPTQPSQSVLEIRAATSKWFVVGGVIFLSAGMFAAAVVFIVNVAS